MLSEIDIRRLVETYNTRAPRYTSYPTSPQWADADGAQLYPSALAQCTGDQPIAVYVHVPFCRRLCLYCGCSVRITRRQDLIDRYLAAVVREVDVVADHMGGVATAGQLHLGGGTPTFLSSDELARVIDRIDQRFPRATDSERSIEVDPRVTSRDQLAMLRDRGFSRVSIGVQDLDENVQAAIRREYSADSLREFVSTCRALGFASVNLDLIYGLPLQSERTWARTLATITEVRPDRLAVYGYAHVPWAKRHQRALDRHGIPSPAARLAMLLQVRGAMIDSGYVAIGMDHFALPTDELATAFAERRVHRNFMGYTVNSADTMVAFGASAIGDFPSAYVHNHMDVEGYCERIEQTGFATFKQHAMSQDDRIRRRAIIRLMGNFSVRPRELEREFGIDFYATFAREAAALDGFVDAGLLDRNVHGWHATEAGILVIRNVAMVFDRYLEADLGRADRYSASI